MGWVTAHRDFDEVDDLEAAKEFASGHLVVAWGAKSSAFAGEFDESVDEEGEDIEEE